MFCSNCGSEIKDEIGFCNNCGAKIVNKSKFNFKKLLIPIFITLILLIVPYGVYRIYDYNVNKYVSDNVYVYFTENGSCLHFTNDEKKGTLVDINNQGWWKTKELFGVEKFINKKGEEKEREAINKIKKIVIDNKIIVKDASALFCFDNLEEIINIKRLDTSQCSNFSFMFAESNIKESYIDYLDIKNGNDFQGMYQECEFIEEFTMDSEKNIIGKTFFDVENHEIFAKGLIESAIRCDDLFEGCKKLKKVFLTMNGFISLGDAFKGCENLESIQVGDDAYFISNCYKIFEGCSKLNEVKMGDNVYYIMNNKPDFGLNDDMKEKRIFYILGLAGKYYGYDEEDYIEKMGEINLVRIRDDIGDDIGDSVATYVFREYVEFLDGEIEEYDYNYDEKGREKIEYRYRVKIKIKNPEHRADFLECGVVLRTQSTTYFEKSKNNKMSKYYEEGISYEDEVIYISGPIRNVYDAIVLKPNKPDIVIVNCYLNKIISGVINRGWWKLWE